MSQAHSEDEQSLWKLEGRSVGAGLAGGLLGGLAMGVFFQLGTDVMPVLGRFLGAESAVIGWLVHLLMSLFLGAAFALVLGYPPIRDFTASFGSLEYALAGITYVYAVAAVTIGVLPLVFELPWVTSVLGPLVGQGESGSLMALLPAAAFALGHLVYGAILGTVYATVGGSS